MIKLKQWNLENLSGEIKTRVAKSIIRIGFFIPAWKSHESLKNPLEDSIEKIIIIFSDIFLARSRTTKYLHAHKYSQKPAAMSKK